jgi:hypothetical protein
MSIRLKPDFPSAFYSRAQVWKQKDQFAAAIADYRKYLDLGGGVQNGHAEEVEQMIRELEKKL